MSDLITANISNVDLSLTIKTAVPIIMRVPCPVPVKTSFGTMFDRPAVFLELEDQSGHKGLGEVWCNFPVCGAEHRALLLETAILPSLIGVTFDDPNQCFISLGRKFERLAIQAGEKGPIAQCIAGIDVAMWDLVARRAGLPLFRLLGGTEATISTYASGINPANASEMVDKCRDEGHTAFKLKIGFDRQSDFQNMEEISSNLKLDEEFMVDANQAWTVDEASELLPKLAEFSLGWLEEPIMADRPSEEWLTLSSSSSVPLAAGENILNGRDFDLEISRPILDVIQPDLCKWGGISGVLPMAHKVIKSGKRYCPHYLGGGVGLAASAHLLAAISGDGMLEIDSNENSLRDDIFLLPISQGRLTLPDSPGLGVADNFTALLEFVFEKEAPK